MRKVDPPRINPERKSGAHQVRGGGKWDRVFPHCFPYRGGGRDWGYTADVEKKKKMARAAKDVATRKRRADVLTG